MIENKTIQDFGDQWTFFKKNDGFYGSQTIFQDYFGSLLNLADLKGSRVADIGSGTGRIVQMLLDSGVEHVFAVEPSKAFSVLKQNLKNSRERVTFLNISGDQLPPNLHLDWVFSLGVIHHIPEPFPVIQAAFNSLKSGGKCAIWVYGYENNKTYVFINTFLRHITSVLPHWLLFPLSLCLALVAWFYAIMGKTFPMPMGSYLSNVFLKLSLSKKLLVIYDQLNPNFSKYYRQEELEDLFRKGGFMNLRAFHRHGYSWTMVGEKSVQPQ